MLWKKNNEDLDEFTEDNYLDQKFDYKGKKIILLLIPLIIAVIAVVLYLFMFVFNKDDKQTVNKAPVVTIPEAPSIVYIDMNDIISTLMPSDSKQNFLKLSFSLVIENKKDAEIISTKMNVIKDSFQGFFRELRPDDLTGSAGLIMLRTELLKRVNKIAAPIEVKDILFKEILVS